VLQVRALPFAVSLETDLHAWLAARSPASNRVPVPVGDDLAVLRTGGGEVLVGSDQVMDGVHFELDRTTPELVGQKAANRNFSDVAAMAAWPVGVTVTLALPSRCDGALPQRIMLGIEAACDAFDVPILGGDTGTWGGPLAVGVTVLAEPRGGRIVTRAGGRPGDSLFVTGKLGGSLPSGRHLTFTPRVREARQLVRRWEVHAMIDLSDGLSRDLPRLCQASGVGVELEGQLIPCHDDLAAALQDGEDYELLLAAPRCDDAIRIGRLTTTGDVRLDGEPLRAAGWEHE
jgi:thiamine-monophosphate kinase